MQGREAPQTLNAPAAARHQGVDPTRNNSSGTPDQGQQLPAPVPGSLAYVQSQLQRKRLGSPTSRWVVKR
jgi:hypothetical protein